MNSANLLAYFKKEIGGFGAPCGWRHNEGISSCFYDWDYLALRANPTGHLLGSNCFGILVIIRFFRTLVWLTNKSGGKIMALNQKLVKNLLPQTLTFGIL